MKIPLSMKNQISRLPPVERQSLRSFLAHTESVAKQNDITISYGSGYEVNLGPGRAGGYFTHEDSDKKKRLRVAVGNKPLRKWMNVLVHETCHLDQYLENSPYWHIANNDVYDIQYAFFAGASPDHSEVIEAMNKIVRLEADCERRTVQKIKDFNLPMCPYKYQQNANTYLLGHTALVHYKKWFKISPYKIPRLVQKMPLLLEKPEWYHVDAERIDPVLFNLCFI